MSETRPGSPSELPEGLNRKGGSTRDIMMRLTKSGTPQEAIMSARIAGFEGYLSTPIEAKITEELPKLGIIKTQFEQIGTTAIQENKIAYEGAVQECAANAALLAADRHDKIENVQDIYQAFFNTIIPGLSVKPPSAETITTYTTLINNIASTEKKLEALNKKQEELIPRIQNTITMGLRSLPENHRNAVSRRLDQPKPS